MICTLKDVYQWEGNIQGFIVHPPTPCKWVSFNVFNGWHLGDCHKGLGQFL